MATVDKPSRVRNVAEASRRVLDPLRRLRGYIRLYVSLEATTIVLLYIAACAWISLVIDYGAFKIPFLSWDWVQEVPARWPRVLITLGFVAGMLVLIFFKAILRLIQRFRDAALALELERRFPKILGDRLITAVELSNRRKVIEQGYSAAMVDETIVEAAERVEKLPLKEVFRWSRLWIMAFFVFLLTVVLYFVVAAGYATLDYAVNGTGMRASFGDYNEVLTIWFERNVLLQNTIWPRKAYLVFLEPADSNLRIGRDKTTPPIRVRANVYVVADSKEPEGWRLLTWNDLETKKNLIGGQSTVAPGDWKVRDENVGLTVDEVDLLFGKFDMRKGDTDAAGQFQVRGGKQSLPFQWALADPSSDEGWRPLAWKDLSSDYLFRSVPNLPRGWKPPREPSLGYTIDEVEATMAKTENQNDESLADVRNVLAQLDRLADMRKTLDKVDDHVADSSMRRTMRKLIVPITVTVTVRGTTTNTTMTLTKMPDNEFAGQFGELKEKSKDAWPFTYYARGEDYYTQKRKLTILPPPVLLKLSREEERPAYLYYRPGNPSDAKESDIKGKKQSLERSEVSLTGGEVVTLDVPAGTNLTLIGEADKDLTSVHFFTQPRGGPDADPDVQLKNGKEFSVTLPNVRQDRAFDVEMLDGDQVSGKRKLKIRVTRDNEPSVDVGIAEWVRKGKDGYIVTAKARIPFSGNIKDDNGLSKVRYAYTVSKIESTAVVDVKALYASGVVGMIAPDGGGVFHGTTFLAGGLHEYDKAKNAQLPENKNVKYFPADEKLSISRFESALRGDAARRDEFIGQGEITRLMAKRQPANFRPLLKEFKFEQDPLAENLVADPFHSDFDVKVANLLGPDSRVLVRYRLYLWIEATDNDLDSTRAIDGEDGPKTSTSKERYLLVVVPEEELVGEIAKEEEQLSININIALDKLQDSKTKLDQIKLDLGSGDLKPAELSPMSVRCEGLEQALDSAQGMTKEVFTKYQSLFKELKGNDIQGAKLKNVLEEIIRPLEDVNRFEFDDAKQKIQDLRKALDGKDNFSDVKARAQKAEQDASKQLQLVIDKVQGILDKMQKGIELSKVIEELRKINQHLEHSRQIVDQIKKDTEKRLLEGALNP